MRLWCSNCGYVRPTPRYSRTTEQLKLFCQAAARNCAAQDCLLCLVPDRLAGVRSAEGLRGCEKVYGFEPVALALRVVAVEQVEPGREVDRARQIAKVAGFEVKEMHAM